MLITELTLQNKRIFSEYRWLLNKPYDKLHNNKLMQTTFYSSITSICNTLIAILNIEHNK